MSCPTHKNYTTDTLIHLQQRSVYIYDDDNSSSNVFAVAVLLLLAMSNITVALSHYCCRTTLQCQCHITVLKLSIDRV